MATNHNVAHLSAHPSYWRPEGDRKERNQKAILARNREREACPNCGRVFSVNGLGRHKAKCIGLAPARTSKSHNKCACGNLKATSASRCYRCAGPDDPADWAEMDRLIAAGINKSRVPLSALKEKHW